MSQTDWKTHKLGDVVAGIQAGTSVVCEDRTIENGDLGVLKTSAVVTGRFSPAEHKAALPDEKHRVSTPVRDGTVLICRKNTAELVGRCALVDGEYPNLYLPDLLWEIQVKPDVLTPHWLHTILTSDRVRHKIKSIAVGTSGSMKGISMRSFRDLEIPVPPLPEQKRIATILSTWDRAIELTDRLIEACERRKRGLMEGLLGGRMRLSGFSGTWETHRLGEFLTEFSKKNSANEDLTVLSCSKVHGIVPQSQIFAKRVASKDIRRYKVLERGDLVYDPMLLWDASIGFMDAVERGVVSPAYYTLRLDESKADKGFFSHLFDGSYMRHQYKLISRGTNVRRKKAPADEFLTIKISTPQLEEQKAISSALISFSDELVALTVRQRMLHTQKNSLARLLLASPARRPIL